MPIERDHLYVIPPGTYLAVADGALHLSQPLARHGARLPFDFLLHALAADRGPLAACVILSGTGADGSLGLKAVKEHGGLVIAQDPDEAGYDGMPRNAIMTGARGSRAARGGHPGGAAAASALDQGGRPGHAAGLAAADHRASAHPDGA